MKPGLFVALALAIAGLAACSRSADTARDPVAKLGSACAHQPDVAALTTGSDKWADAFAVCLEKNGQHPKIDERVDAATGAKTFVVRWGDHSSL